MSFTQIPDLLVDCGMLNAYELAAALFIARKTVGWGKTTDGISLNQFMDALKLSKPTVIKTIQGLVDHQIVKKTESFRENGGQSYNRYAFTAAFIDAANQPRLGNNNGTPVNDINRGEGKAGLQEGVKEIDRPSKGDLLPPVNDVDPQDKPINKTNLKQNKPSPHSPPQPDPAQVAGEPVLGAGLVDVAVLEFPATLADAECASARKILCGLEDSKAQLLLDTLAAKLHAGEKIANRMGLLRWMVGKLGAGELDTSAGTVWRAGVQRRTLAEADIIRQQLNDLGSEIQTLQNLRGHLEEGSLAWQSFAEQIEARKAEWYRVKEMLQAAAK